MAINKTLKELRTSAGLSQLEVSKKCGWGGPQYVSNFERGVSLPSIRSLKALSKLYKTDLNYMKKIIFDESVNKYANNIRKKLWP